jgi:hypothetical protein
LAETLLQKQILNKPLDNLQPREPRVLVNPPSPPHFSLPPPAQEDPVQIISRIQMNVENFGALLGHIVKPNPDEFLASLYYKSDEELKLLLKVIERARLVGNMSNQFKHVFWLTTSALEAGAPIIGVKAQGLNQALRVQQEEIQLILKEMALDRADSFEQAQRPEIRLAFLVSTTLLSVDGLNRMKHSRRAPEPEPVEKKANEYNDL